MKKIMLTIFITFSIISNIYADKKDQTDWWVLKKHWGTCKTKDHDLDLEYMTRVPEYSYTILHQRPMRKIAVLPPSSIIGKFAFKSLGYFEDDVLFNTKEMEEEYLIKPKKWSVVKGRNESFKILKEKNLYDKYLTFVETFTTDRVIDKELFSKMAEILEVDTFLLMFIGFDRPGAASIAKSKGWSEEPFYLLNIFLIDAADGKIIWEYGCELESPDAYIMTRWRGIYRAIYKIMPVE